MDARRPLSRALVSLIFVAACGGSDDGNQSPPDEDGGHHTTDGSTSNTDGSTATADGSVSANDAGVTPDGSTPPNTAGFRVVGYYPAWATYTRDYQVSEIPAAGLTHINYAFANIANGRCVLGDAWADTDKTFPGDTWDQSSAHQAGNFNQLRKLRQANPSLRTLISVGGWTWSTAFSDAASTAEKRAIFASSCVDFAVTHGFDGIDIDWEYPVGGGLPGNGNSPNDKHNYTLLLQALRAELDARRTTLGRAEPFLLTIAAPAGPSIIGNLESEAIAATIDWINVMSYDFHGSWENTTGFNAPLRPSALDPLPDWNVEAALERYLEDGVPPGHLVMGVPFYGRSWQGVTAGATHGLYQSATGAGPGTWENGVLDYHDIAANYLGAGFTVYRDPASLVPFAFNANTGVFITYDDPESLAHKRAFAIERELGGVMVWDMSSDTSSSTLLDALH